MRRFFLLSAFLLGFGAHTLAAERTFFVATNAAMINHWPSADGFIGTADDMVSGSLSKNSKSSPNSYGTYSFLVTLLSTGNEPDPFLFAQWNTATFVTGSVTINPAVLVTTNVPLLTALQFNGTELFPEHGLYSVRLTSRRGGAPSYSGSAFTYNASYDFEGTFTQGIARGTNATANGVSVLLEAADFAAPNLTGIAGSLSNYVKNVAIPLAQTQGASALLCGNMNLSTTRSVPGSAAGFPALNAYGVVLGLEFPQLRILNIQVVSEGIKLQWTPLAGKSYEVEAAGALGSAFAPLSPLLTQTEYIDTSARTQGPRFYRIHIH